MLIQKTHRQPCSWLSHSARPCATGALDQMALHSLSICWGTRPPQSGPMTPPASAEAPMSPSGNPRWPGGKRSPAIAMATGTSAPAPIAWKTRAPIRISKSGNSTPGGASKGSIDSRSGTSATATEPAMKTAIAAKNTCLRPQTSETRPISGIAAR